MKIALIGYGKMGQMIEQLALGMGHEVVLRIDKDNLSDFTAKNLQKVEVAIEFSRPEVAFDNLATCIRAGIPVISGTTGWLDRKAELDTLCLEQKGAFLYASNFSIGVNIFFALNAFLAKMMNAQSQYTPSMEEIHHTQKLDAPSGTAITLAEGILEETARKKSWVNEESHTPDQLSIISKRVDKVPGTHTVSFESEVDSIEIKHTAHSREGFVRGAILAAEWIIGKQGVFSMKDVLNF
ncbi:MAG: 4-hydroxy-tetrahydrodipicolinate reductase [Saprospiraceae bacterium]|jgi:4-hydroxy-tetrahydrodipicolinate reductase